MSKFLQFLDQLFSQNKKQIAEIPFIHEVIDVSAAGDTDLTEWLSTDKWSYINDLVISAYNNYLITGQSSYKEITILKSGHMNGWSINCSRLDLQDSDYKLVAHLLYSRIDALNYVLNLAETKSQRRSKNIETITKYYLKPSLKGRFANDNDLVNQMYGNVTIEYASVNGTPDRLKFFATSYIDHKYSKALDFDDLLAIVMDS